MLRFSNIFFFLLIVCFSCSTSTLSTKKEGFIGNTFRVYVRINSLDISETATDSDLDKLLIDQGVRRFRELMVVFGSEAKQETVIQDFIKNDNKPQIVYKREKEDYAEAYIDFTVNQQIVKVYQEKYPAPKKDANDDDE